jgi:hypothetical protein
MQQTAVQVISIHDRQGSVLTVDLNQVLAALEPDLGRWTWCVTLLDCMGGEYSQAVCEAVERARPSGLWMSSQELLKLAEDIHQTIEGEWIAFPSSIKRDAVTAEDLDLSFFAVSRAELALVVVDSSFVEIYAKDLDVVSRLRRHFKDVRLHDPALYFQKP